MPGDPGGGADERGHVPRLFFWLAFHAEARSIAPMQEPSPIERELRPVRIPTFTLHWLRLLIPLVITGLAVRFFWSQMSAIEQGWLALRDLSPELLIVAVSIEMISYAGLGYMLSAMARMLNDWLPVRRGMLIILAGNSIGLVAGGTLGVAALVYRWIRAAGGGGELAALAGTLPLLFLNLIFVPLSIVGLVNLFLAHQLTAFETIAFGITLVMLILTAAILFWGLRRPEWLRARLSAASRRWASWRRKPYDQAAVDDFVSRLVDTWIMLIRGGWRGPFLGTAFYIALDIGVLYLVFYAIGYPLSPGLLLSAYGLPMLIGRLPLVPGGIGVVEAMMLAVLTALNVPQDIAIIGTLGFRLIDFWLPTVFGFFAAIYLQRASPPVRSPA